MNQNPLEEAERMMLDLKDDDVFPIEEKWKMLGHMVKKEWMQLGLIVVQRAMADWTSDKERNEFLKKHYDLPGSLYERGQVEAPVTGYRGLFQLSDLQYKFVRAMAEVWRLGRDA